MAETGRAPKLWIWALGTSLAAGVTSVFCCVAPSALFLFGLIGGAQAVSFTNAFYGPGGRAGAGAWALRLAGAGVAAAGVWLYRRRAAACSADRRLLRRRAVIAAGAVAALALVVAVGLYQLSGWYFDRYVVPAQQAELRR
jgi:hypothetical protein